LEDERARHYKDEGNDSMIGRKAWRIASG